MFREMVMGSALATALLVPALAYGSDSVSTQTAAASSEWEQLVKAAQKEGQLNLVLASQLGRKLRPVVPVFEKKYGIKVTLQTGGGRENAERILAERRVGRFNVDVYHGGANTPLVQFIPNGVLAPFPPLLVLPEVKDQSLWYQGKHHYTDVEHRYIFSWGASPSYNVAINTNMVKPDEIKSYADLLNPKWKGKIVSWSPGAQGTAASTVPMYLNPKIGEKWFRRWANEMDVTIVKDARQGAEWVAVGRYPIGMFGMTTQADLLHAQGLPIIGWLPQPMAEGEVLSSSGANIMAVDKAPHPNAQKLFINWALSREGQALFMKYGQDMDSLRRDVDNKIIAEQYRIRNDADYMVAFTNPDYVSRQTEIINKLLKIMSDAGYK